MQADNPLLRFEPGLMIWTVLTFLVLLAVLRKLAWKPLLEALDSREKRIDDALLKAEKAQREAEQAIAENRKRSDEAMRQAEQLIDQARKDAEQTRQKMIEEARAESRRVVEQDMRRLEAEQRAAMQEMRSIAADLAIRAAGRLIQSSMTEQQQREIVDQFLKEVRQETAN
ncbi:MAG: F0F1 ATP synthase subunit B [Bryobacterales bacterium]